MRKGVEAAANLLFWVLTAWLILSAFSITTQEIEIVDGRESIRVERSRPVIQHLSLLLMFAASLFYANRWWMQRQVLAFHGWRLFAGSVVILVLTGGLYALVQVLLPLTNPQLPIGLVAGILGFYYASSLAYGGLLAWESAERRQRELLLEKRAAELRLLRNQLQPHFLFNTLNNMLSMVDQNRDPLLADSLSGLSELLRYVVYDTEAGTVTVAQELAFLKRFSELQLLRHAPEDVRFTWHQNGEYEQQPMEPGILIPFLENAFQYGVNPDAGAEIQVSIDLTEADTVRFSVSNTVVPDHQHKSGSGSGLPSVKRRLALVYPDRHELIINPGPPFSISLTIQTA